MGKLVLVVDDEKNITDIIRFNLKKDGYDVLCAKDGEEGLELAFSKNPDLILLDIMMPKMDGYEVCKRIRQKLSTPIIMLTARAEEVDKVLGLELGADDYVTKPFGIRELMARVRANLRRSSALDSGADHGSNIMVFGAIEIDMDMYEARKGGVAINLTNMEFELLKFLAMHKTQVFTREALLEKVWGYEYAGDIRTVDVTVRRLREKIEENSSEPKYVITRRGVGYYFNG